VLMAAMCGGSARGDGGDDERQPDKERRDSWNCHMIGHEGCFLRQVNGKLVKSRLFDIGPKSWRKITKVEKDHAFDNYIRRKFHWNAEDEDTIRKYVMKDLGKKWREDRQTLWDKLCDPTEQKEHNYKQKPKKVDAAKWQTFVDHRMSKYMKKISAINKANRAKQKIYHTSGSKSIMAKGKEVVN
ncbi:hypothetical protein LINPERHAP1_LOCUS2048, partial [Linum perenne]